MMGCKCAVFVILSTAAVMVSLGDSSEVKERTANYSCCGSLELKSKPHCESIWSVNNKIIAHSHDMIKTCTTPCRRIEDGLMTLDMCVNVNVTINCVHMGIAVEEEIHYQSQMCPAHLLNRMAPGNQCCVWLLLLAVAISGWIVSPLL